MGSLRIVALGAVALVLAGCSGGGSDTAAAPEALAPAARHGAPLPTDRELRWIGALERWYDDQQAFSTLFDCSRTLARDVDAAPTRRLQPFRATAVRICRLFERANADEQRAFTRSDAELAARASAEFRDAERAMSRLRRSLDAYRPHHDRPLPVVAGPSPRSRVDPGLTRIARSIVGRRRAEVRCWSGTDWSRLSRAMDVGAFAGPGGFRAHLAANECNRILRFGRSPRVPEDAYAKLHLAYSLTVFSHEVEHLTGNLDEAVTECYALQKTRGLARRLGASRAVAAEVVRLYWKHVYPSNTAPYRSAQCRDGGQLDLRPASSEWP